MPPAAMLSGNDPFEKMAPDRQARLLDKVRKRPLDWRLAAIFKDGDEPEMFDAGTNGRGRPVRFLVSTSRNAAGFFLGWRDVEGKDGAREVYDHIAEKIRDTCRERMLDRALAFARVRGNVEEARRLTALVVKK